MQNLNSECKYLHSDSKSKQFLVKYETEQQDDAYPGLLTKSAGK